MNIITRYFKRPIQQQFDQLLRPHIPHLYKVALRLAHSTEDAEDLVQDLLIKLFPRTEELAEIENLRPWLSKILYRQFIDQWRKQSRIPPSISTTDDQQQAIYDELPAQTAEPYKALTQHQLKQNLDRALQALNPEQRTLICLHLMDGYDLNELALVFEVPVGTIKSRIHRIKAQLKISLNKMEPLVALVRVNK